MLAEEEDGGNVGENLLWNSSQYVTFAAFVPFSYSLPANSLSFCQYVYIIITLYVFICTDFH